jgi:hypothetical protein
VLGGLCVTNAAYAFTSDLHKYKIPATPDVKKQSTAKK